MNATVVVRRLAVRAVPKPLINRLVELEQLRAGEPELMLVRVLLGKRGGLVDVGANEGPYSRVAARLGRPVCAFEPNPEVAPRLRRFLGPRAKVYQVALSDTVGVAPLYVPRQGAREIDTRGSLEEGVHAELARRRIEVSVATLDSFDLRGVALIKIDVEGHERRVLQGSMQTLTRELPNLVIEVEEHRCPGNLDEIRQTLTRLGYEGHFVLDGDLLPMSSFALDRHQRPENAPLWGHPRVGRYVNNFIWVSPTHRGVTDELRKRARLPRLLAVVSA